MNTVKTQATRIAVLLALVALVLGAVYLGLRGDNEQSIETEAPATHTVAVGEQAPHFTALDSQGQPVDSDAFAGRTWLVFNATWCASCRSEIPEIQQLAERPDVEVVAIYLKENTAQVRDFAEKLDLTYTQVPDANGEISAAYGMNSVPAHVLIEDGEVTYLKTGALRASDITDVLGE
ncbi:MAG: TlpA disulfide reductase family protein [Actinomycetaceae bacterium]|nr:TlpA disulfide reductase family protein [Actinomycetaceae bacterium]